MDDAREHARHVPQVSRCGASALTSCREGDGRGAPTNKPDFPVLDSPQILMFCVPAGVDSTKSAFDSLLHFVSRMKYANVAWDSHFVQETT